MPQYILYLKKSGLIEEDAVTSHLTVLSRAWVTANLTEMWDKTVSSAIQSLRETSSGGVHELGQLENRQEGQNRTVETSVDGQHLAFASWLEFMESGRRLF